MLGEFILFFVALGVAMITGTILYFSNDDTNPALVSACAQLFVLAIAVMVCVALAL